VLCDKDFELLPDFPTNGLADFSAYSEGRRGGRVRVRSKIEILDKKTLVIRNVPFSVTTGSLIESIIKANDSGKIKIKQLTDNTAQNVEIMVELQKGISPDVTIDALYAFTNCEVSISTNACVIKEDKPVFMSVKDILRESTQKTVDLLKLELQIKKEHLLEKWHFSSLERIFIEKKIYRKIEDCETWESVIETIDKGLKPHIAHLLREVTREDIIRLTEIKIKRISKFDSFKAEEYILQIERDLDEVEYNLNHIIEFAIHYFEDLLKKYGKGRERKTEIRTFDNIEAKNVAAATKKLYVNREEGFFGFGLKKEENIGECSELDDIIVFRRDGKYSVMRVDEKVFAGKDIVHIDVFRKDDERMTYNVVYFDGKTKRAMVKRYNITSINRDKEYDLTMGHSGSKILHLTANPLGETEIVTVSLTPSCKARKKIFEFDFASIEIRGRNSMGNILTRYPVRRIVTKSVNTSNVLSIDVWYDEYVGKLNTKEIGKHLGKFVPEDLLISFASDGYYELKSFDLNNHYDIDKIIHIEKFNPERVYSVVYFNGDSGNYFVKRFSIETSRTNTSFRFINDHKDSRIIILSNGDKTIIKYTFTTKNSDTKETETIDISGFIEIMGWKSVGKKLSSHKINSVKLVEVIYEEKKEEAEIDVEDLPDEEYEDTDEENMLTDDYMEEKEDEPADQDEKNLATKKPASKKKPPKDGNAEQLSLF